MSLAGPLAARTQPGNDSLRGATAPPASKPASSPDAVPRGSASSPINRWVPWALPHTGCPRVVQSTSQSIGQFRRPGRPAGPRSSVVADRPPGTFAKGGGGLTSGRRRNRSGGRPTFGRFGIVQSGAGCAPQKINNWERCAQPAGEGLGKDEDDINRLPARIHRLAVGGIEQLDNILGEPLRDPQLGVHDLPRI
jgi:hypothetical protein